MLKHRYRRLLVRYACARLPRERSEEDRLAFLLAFQSSVLKAASVRIKALKISRTDKEWFSRVVAVQLGLVEVVEEALGQIACLEI